MNQFKIVELIQFLTTLSSQDMQDITSNENIEIEDGYITVSPFGEDNYFKIEVEWEYLRDNSWDDPYAKEVVLIQQISYWNWADDKPLHEFDGSNIDTVFEHLPRRQNL